MPKKIKDVELVECKGADGKTYERVPCEIYTRCMGYIRPISGRNIGKKSEGYSRKYFLESKIDNSEFLKKYANAKKVEN